MFDRIRFEFRWFVLAPLHHLKWKLFGCKCFSHRGRTLSKEEMAALVKALENGQIPIRKVSDEEGL